MIEPAATDANNIEVPVTVTAEEIDRSEEVEGRDPKKNKPTPTNSGNSAAAAAQPCPEQ
jgi:hypothetical protein